jgi:hypothetical protein
MCIKSLSVHDLLTHNLANKYEVTLHTLVSMCIKSLSLHAHAANAIRCDQQGTLHRAFQVVLLYQVQDNHFYKNMDQIY